MSERPAPLDPALVEALVANAHGDLEAVWGLLDREPTLVNAAWDWGGGDWETALGAAAHMGRRDIALFLLDRGARLDIFAAAMLGWVDVVAAMLDARPDLREAKGPHGITLATHAEQGGEGALGVLAMLASKAPAP
jgi:hypothetical protein